MKRVIVESPYAGDIPRNVQYLQYCLRWCLEHNMAPFASHQMYTTCLQDSNPEERVMGICAGFEWWNAASEVYFFIDLGISRGMAAALDRCTRFKKPYHFINLAEQPDAPAHLNDLLSGLSRNSQPSSGVRVRDQG